MLKGEIILRVQNKKPLEIYLVIFYFEIRFNSQFIGVSADALFIE